MRIPLLTLLLTVAVSLTGQDLTAPLLSGSWQSAYHNPAMVHFLPSRVTVGLPGIAHDLRLQNVDYADIFERDGSSNIVNLAAWAAGVEERNAVRDDYAVETIGGALRGERFSYHFYHRLRVRGDADYPRSLVNVIALGNAAIIGQTVDVAPRGGIVSYHELAFGLGYAPNDRVAVSGRIKYLSGASGIEAAEGGGLRLTTGNENFTLTLDKDLTLNSVGAFDFRSLDDFDLTYRPARLRAGDLFAGNNGLAIDLGVAVNLDRLRLNASVTDIGATIDWKENITTLRFEGTSSFSGLDVLDDLLRDTLSLESAVDSLVVSLEPEVGSANYQSRIAASIFLGGEYDVTDRLTAGALLILQDRLGELVPTVALVGRYAVTDWLQLGLNLNHRSGMRTHLGLHMLATPGKFQFFAASDKFFSLLTSGNRSVAGFRLGAALTLGDSRSSAAFRPEYR